MENRPPKRKGEETPAKRPGAVTPPRSSGEGSRTALARLIELEKARKGSGTSSDDAETIPDELPPGD